MVFNTSNVTPSAYIATHKNRLKTYDGKIYLKDKQNFQIELFNPYHSNVLAKIKINGSPVGSGIIIKPGQRVFLERYLDEAKLFEFQTYKVPKNDSEVDNAIRNNGSVEVEFFAEEIQNYSQITTFSNNCNDWINVYGSGTSTGGYVHDTLTSGSAAYFTNTNSVNLNYDISETNTRGIVGTQASHRKRTKSKTKETGRIEKGKDSNQKLTEVDMNFSTFAMSSYDFKLVPKSQQSQYATSFKTYCEECGYRIRSSSAKFCSRCGNKIR